MLRLSARRRRLAIKLGSVMVLLLAVMPQVLYLGHPISEAPATEQTTAGAAHEHHDQAAAEHAGHCHVGPKGCAGADGVAHIALLSRLISIAPEGPGFDTLESHDSTQTFILWQRPEKPPQTI
jgi:hypothetical protein